MDHDHFAKQIIEMSEEQEETKMCELPQVSEHHDSKMFLKEHSWTMKIGSKKAQRVKMQMQREKSENKDSLARFENNPI